MSNIRHWLVVLLAAFPAACAAPGPIPATTQPALSAVAQPYASQLQTAGITSVQVFSNSPRVRVATNFGEIYLRYPASLTPTAFVVYAEAGKVEVDSDAYNAGNSAQYDGAIKAILPEAIRSANENNVRVINNRYGKN